MLGANLCQVSFKCTGKEFREKNNMSMARLERATTERVALIAIAVVAGIVFFWPGAEAKQVKHPPILHPKTAPPPTKNPPSANPPTAPSPTAGKA